MNSLRFLSFALTILAASSASLADNKPAWISGKSLGYPDKQYLLGVGYGETREAAEKNAYAAISKIFSANIISSSKDYEIYSQVKTAGKTESQETKNIERSTNISTGRILENIAIAESWYDGEENMHYVLAVIDRQKAAASLGQKIHSLDLQIEEMVNKCRENTGKIQKLRNLKGAVAKLAQREAGNEDLRVINYSGLGINSPINSITVNDELADFLKNDFAIGIEVSGEEREGVKSAIIEGLNKEGFSIAKAGRAEDVIVKGEAGFEEADIPNSGIIYIRWTANFQLTDKGTGKVLGSISRSGKEGHVSLHEAKSRAVMALENEVANEVIVLVEFMYGGENHGNR